MNLQQQLGEWYPLLSHLFDTEWMQKLGRRVGAAENVQPRLDLLFRAFQLCPPSRVQVVILGQDPYINGEADGLAFSSYGKLTPSLEVIFAEINRTHSFSRTQTHLDDWAEQGVLLLNAVLTTRLGKSKAHEGWGWEYFLKSVLFEVNKLRQPIVYMMWGKDAQRAVLPGQREFLNKELGTVPTLYLKAYHPQAQNYNPSNKFIGCNHFVQANLFLMQQGLSPIWWPNIDKRGHHSYTALITHLQKHMRDAEINFPEVVYSYTPVSNKPHPFSIGLEPGDRETLPF